MKEDIFLTLKGVNAPELVELVAERVCQRLTPLIKPMHQKDPDELVNIKMAARILNVSPSSINRYARDGLIVRRKAGKRVLFRVGDLYAFVQEHKV